MPEIAKARDHLPRAPPGSRVEARRRLVEEEQFRVADQRKAHVEPALLPAGQPGHAVVGLLREPDQLDRLVHPARRVVVAGEELDRLAHSELRVHAAVLEHDPDPLAPLLAGIRRVDAEHRHLPGAALAVALENLDGRRLACAVRTQEGEDLAAGDLEIDAPDRLEVAIGLAQAADADYWWRHRVDCMDAPERARLVCRRTAGRSLPSARRVIARKDVDPPPEALARRRCALGGPDVRTRRSSPAAGPGDG